MLLWMVQKNPNKFHIKGEKNQASISARTLSSPIYSVWSGQLSSEVQILIKNLRPEFWSEARRSPCVSFCMLHVEWSAQASPSDLCGGVKTSFTSRFSHGDLSTPEAHGGERRHARSYKAAISCSGRPPCGRSTWPPSAAQEVDATGRRQWVTAEPQALRAAAAACGCAGIAGELCFG